MLRDMVQLATVSAVAGCVLQRLTCVGRADRCIEGMAQIIDLGDLRLDDCRRISQPGIGQNLDRRRTVSRWDLSSQQQIDAVVAEQDTR
jgi:hypothetical protein